MSLTQDDLMQIRTVVREEVRSVIVAEVNPRLDKMEGEVAALNGDIKDIYKMLTELQELTRPVAHFEKYDLEQKILKSYKNILALAKEANVTLPPA